MKYFILFLIVFILTACFPDQENTTRYSSGKVYHFSEVEGNPQSNFQNSESLEGIRIDQYQSNLTIFGLDHNWFAFDISDENGKYTFSNKNDMEVYSYRVNLSESNFVHSRRDFETNNFYLYNKTQIRFIYKFHDQNKEFNWGLLRLKLHHQIQDDIHNMFDLTYSDLFDNGIEYNIIENINFKLEFQYGGENMPWKELLFYSDADREEAYELYLD